MNSPSDGVEQLAALASRLRSMNAPFPEGRFAGRGIVIAAGGAQLFTNAYILVSILRRTLGCTLPIEIWHFGPEELSPGMARIIEELDVTTVDAIPRLAAEGVAIHDGWQLKSFCLKFCRFEEVLMLDADQVPVIDPAQFFSWPEYRDTGAVFWPDIVEIKPENPIWDAMGLLPKDPEISFESGQLLVDKRRHWRALSLSLCLNEAAELVYRLIYGDKDTFLLAFRLADAPYALVPHPPFRGDRCLHQRDFAGNVVLQHRTNGKWAYSDDPLPEESFRLFDESLAALRQLRRLWNGRVFNAPDRSAPARAAEVELARASHFDLEVVADDGEPIVRLELWPFGEIGRGRELSRQNWWCETQGSDLLLFIRNGERITYRLVAGNDGSWRGHRLLERRVEATLTPVATDGSAVFGTAPGLADSLLRAIGFPHCDRADWSRFQDAAGLLARVEPGIVARLATIADESGSAPLRELVDKLNPPAFGKPDIQLGIFTSHYRSTLKINDE